MKALIAIASGVLSLMACGGDDGPGSGIDPTRTIESLNMEEARSICEDFIAGQGGAGTTVVCDGFELTVQSVDDCAASVASATCTNTVAELNECSAATEEDACAITGPDCEVIFDCAGGT